jgi:hypothetical protein
MKIEIDESDLREAIAALLRRTKLNCSWAEAMRLESIAARLESAMRKEGGE